MIGDSATAEPVEAALKATAAGLGHGRAAHDLVADAIEHLVAVGGLRPGDRLPPERELARTLGAARVTVRSAIRRLSADGLVTTTRGRTGGTFIAGGPRSREQALASLALFENTLDRAFEYRHILEPAAARLAAERASRADRETLLLLLEQPSADLAGFHELDTKLHLIVARASANPDLHDAITRQRAGFFVLANAVLLPTSAADYPSFSDEHRAIARAVHAGDAPAAGAEMHAHLDRSHTVFAQALAHATVELDRTSG
jgi:DNA-binding FadR family transcriptional regulator